MDYVVLFLESLLDTFIDMSFYIMIGLFFVGLLNTYVKKSTIVRFMGKGNFWSVLKASIVGVPLPLCSCGVVPTAVELKNGGASDGAITSFLISTPQTGVDSIFATYSVMGLFMAIFRPIAAFFSGIIGGIVTNIFSHGKKSVTKVELPAHSCCSCSGEKESEPEPAHSCCSCGGEKESEPEPAHSCCCGGEKEPEPEPAPTSSCSCGCGGESMISGRVAEKKPLPKWTRVFTYGFGGFLNKITVHFIIGVIIAALISAFIPADFFINLGLDDGILSMLGMIVIGLPMYICSSSSIPIAVSLVSKGLSLGSAFVFIFVGPVTNIASIILLNKSLGKKFTAIYMSSVVVCAIVFGYLLNFLVSFFSISIPDFTSSGTSDMHGAMHYVQVVFAIIFGLLLVRSLVEKAYNRCKKSKL